MKQEEKYLKYKDRVVFGKQYAENEACYVFVNKGEVSVRSQIEPIHLDKSYGLLAKCLNYFFDFYIKQVELDRLLENFKESINILLDNPGLADENIIKTKLKEFVLLVSKSQEAPSQLDFLAALFRPLDIEFKITVQNNLYSNLSLDELAALCHLSTSSFKRKFGETFNNSPKKYIAQKKVERSAELLKSRDLRISDIAYDVGFDSLATFNRNFSNLYGKSPSEYRLS